MKLDLSLLFEGGQDKLEFSHTLDLSQFEQWGHKPFKKGTKLEGFVENRSQIVTLDYCAECELDLVCDRCLKRWEQKRFMKFTHIVVSQLNEESSDSFVVVPDLKLDIDELAFADIILKYPMNCLCKQDCKGICSKCGVDLNEQTCNCNHKTIDPRLEVLANLLKENEQ